MKRIHIYILLLFLAFFTGFGVASCAMRTIYAEAIKAAPNETAKQEPPEINAETNAEIVVETVSETETVVETSAPVEERKPVYIEVNATAYCPCVKCCGKTDGITATGTKATAGRTIAVDPDVIPYGTEVIINGHTYVAEDCGGAINKNDIDIFFDTHEEALQFGRQVLTAYYYE